MMFHSTNGEALAAKRPMAARSGDGGGKRWHGRSGERRSAERVEPTRKENATLDSWFVADRSAVLESRAGCSGLSQNRFNFYPADGGMPAKATAHEESNGVIKWPEERRDRGAPGGGPGKGRSEGRREGAGRRQISDQKQGDKHGLIMQVTVIEPAGGHQGKIKQDASQMDLKGSWLGDGPKGKARHPESKIFKYRQTIKHEPAKAMDPHFFSMVPRSRAQQRSIDTSSDFVHQIVRNNSHSLGKHARRDGGKQHAGSVIEGARLLRSTEKGKGDSHPCYFQIKRMRAKIKDLQHQAAQDVQPPRILGSSSSINRVDGQYQGTKDYVKSDVFKCHGGSYAEVLNVKGVVDLNNSSNVDTRVSATDSRASLGGQSRHGSQRPRSRQCKFKARLGPRIFKDTNTIYPPNQAYNDANEELKSPTKRRPQSGGPSPDKQQITLGDCSDSEQISTQLKLNECKPAATIAEPKPQPQLQQQDLSRIFQDHKETQIILRRAKAEIQSTRKQISQSIAQSQNTLKHYKDQIKEFQKQREKQVQEVLRQQNYRVIQEEVQEELEDGVMATVYKPKYLKKFQKRVEYKYAFGQRIPVDYEWRVRQRQGMELRQKQGKGKDQAFEYDYNGRRVKKAKEGTGEAQEEADDECEEREDIIDVENVEEEPIEDNQSEAQDMPAEASGAGGFVLPDWIKNPFKSRSPSRSASDDNNSEQSNQEKDEAKPTEAPLIKQKAQSGGRPQAGRQKSKGLSKDKRKQRELIIKSKGKGASANSRPERRTLQHSKQSQLQTSHVTSDGQEPVVGAGSQVEDFNGKLNEPGKAPSNAKDGSAAKNPGQKVSRSAQYTIYKRTPAKNSVQEQKTGQNEDLLDAKIDIVNHNQAYQSRLEAQNPTSGWKSAKQSLEFTSGLITQNALSRTTAEEQGCGRESRQAYTNDGDENNRASSPDYKDVNASIAQDASCEVLVSAGQTQSKPNAQMMDLPRTGPDTSAKRKKKQQSKDRYSHQASERHHREQTHAAIQVPLSQFIMPDKLNNQPGEATTTTKKPRQLTCNGLLRQQHRPSTSANKLVSTAKHRAEAEHPNQGQVDELFTQSRNGVPSAKMRKGGESNNRLGLNESLNGMAPKMVLTGPVPALAGNLGQAPSMQRRTVSKQRQSHALEGASRPSAIIDSDLHSVVPKTVPPSAFGLGPRGGSGII